MGFSGGGANILKAHTHDGLVVQDGGSLDFNNITQSNSSAGMVFYSDGTHLQQLAYPGVPAGETLTATALSTAPSWGTAGGASITVQKISPTNGQTSTSTGLVALTAGSATLPTRTGGKAFMVYQQCIEKSTDGFMQQAFHYNGSTQESIQTMIVSPHYITGTNSATDDLDSGTVAMYWACDSGTMTLRNSGNQQSYCEIFEVS